MRDNTEPDNTERDHAEDAMEKTPFRVFTTMLVMALIGITIAKSISYYETKSVNALVAEDWGLGFSENGKPLPCLFKNGSPDVAPNRKLKLVFVFTLLFGTIFFIKWLG